MLADALREPDMTIVQYIKNIVGGSVMETLDSGHDIQSCEKHDPDPDETEDDDECDQSYDSTESAKCLSSKSIQTTRSTSTLKLMSTPRSVTSLLAPATRLTPTLKLMSISRAVTSSSTPTKHKCISPWQTTLPFQGTERTVNEIAQSGNESGAIVGEDAKGLKRKDRSVKRKRELRKKKSIRAGTRVGMASPISKSRSFKSL